VLAVRRAFPARGMLYCRYEVFGASGPDVRTAYELRRPDGSLVRSGPPSALVVDRAGRLVRQVALTLDDLTPGAYRLTLRVEDPESGAVAERLEPLRLEAP
jgi:hypothetical protein